MSAPARTIIRNDVLKWVGDKYATLLLKQEQKRKNLFESYGVKIPESGRLSVDLDRTAIDKAKKDADVRKWCYFDYLTDHNYENIAKPRKLVVSVALEDFFLMSNYSSWTSCIGVGGHRARGLQWAYSPYTFLFLVEKPKLVDAFRPGADLFIPLARGVDLSTVTNAINRVRLPKLNLKTGRRLGVLFPKGGLYLSEVYGDSWLSTLQLAHLLHAKSNGKIRLTPKGINVYVPGFVSAYDDGSPLDMDYGVASRRIPFTGMRADIPDPVFSIFGDYAAPGTRSPGRVVGFERGAHADAQGLLFLRN